ncbi:hypothetical protein [Maribacter sp. 2307UL18-2]|uniref:hypothetical protein n=1 Tax=Maribacter sp. 2307UL18-2 TaxID=3386274 RepID=UPI0039BCCCFE
MKNLIAKVSLLIFTFGIVGCEAPRENLALTLVLDNAIGDDKYPQYVKDIAMPFHKTECEMDFLLKPISFVRADIKRTEVESNAWHFENIGDNTVEFSSGWLQQYFTDSLTTPYLKQPKGGKELKLASYLTKTDNIVVLYSEESELDEYEGVPVLHTSKEVHSKIAETACDNPSKKVVVIINPRELEEMRLESPPLPIGDPLLTENPCGMETLVDAFELKSRIQAIIDVNQTDEQRLYKAEAVYRDFFDDKAYVASYKSKGDSNPDVYDPGEAIHYFTSKLAVLESIHDVAIFRLETSKKSGKISGMHIAECHDAKELL